LFLSFLLLLFFFLSFLFLSPEMSATVEISDSISLGTALEALICYAPEGSKENVSQIKLLLEKYPDMNLSKESAFLLPSAVKRSCAEVMEALLKHKGIDPNSEFEETPFCYVCRRLKGRKTPDPRLMEIFGVMIKSQKVDVSRPNFRKMTPLAYLFSNNQREAIEIWMKSGRKFDLMETDDVMLKRLDAFTLKAARTTDFIEIVEGPSEIEESLRGRCGEFLYLVREAMDEISDGRVYLKELRQQIELHPEFEIDKLVEIMRMAK
jgi:hypothetical protein